MMQNIAMMIIIKLTRLRCVLIAQLNVLIVIRKSILVIEQKNEIVKGKASLMA